MKPIVLCIMDGCAIRKEEHGNAFLQAHKPNFDYLIKEYPHSLLEASGVDVGLPKGQMGNSEVGHMNIGAGRIVYQPLVRIDQAILDKSFFQNENILEVINHTKKNHSKLHIMGLLSDGGIHSHIDHLMALIDLCKKEHITNVYFHMFLDGRDTLPDSSIQYLDMLNSKIEEVGFGSIASISGRYYAMDRDNNWDRIEKTYNVIVYGKGEEYSDYNDAIKHNYDNNIYDEFVVPTILDSKGTLSENDGLILFNYRPDRIRELFSAFTNPSFNEFHHEIYENIKLVTMMPLSDEVVCTNAFTHQTMDNTMGEYLASLGKKQLRIAETEKYAHVTYFFDGGLEKELGGCKRVLIPSPKVATYDIKPEMSAYEITNVLLDELDNDDLDVVILNFANGDMVGHTGVMDATIKAVETVDECIGKIYTKIKEKGGTLIVTADHGNSDYMLDDQNNVITSHSIYRVPFVVTDKRYELKDGKLADIAPTILHLMNLEVPEGMTGDNLLISRKEKWIIFFQRIFLILSIIFIISFAVTYYVTHNSNQPTPVIIEENTNTFSSLLKSFVTTSGDGLYLDDSNYIFKGKSVSNYVNYGGYIWRIVWIDSNNQMHLILEDVVTHLAFGSSNDYETSYVRGWMNKTLDSYSGIFESKVDTSLLVQNDKREYFSLLTEEMYEKTILEDTYLNNGTSFWARTKNNNDLSYIDLTGQVMYASPQTIVGIRPMIMIDGNIETFSGEGTKINPYNFKEEDKLSIGEYLTYSNMTFQIVSVNSNTYQLVLASPLVIDDQDAFTFSNMYNKFLPSEEGSLAYYLNHNFYDMLDKTHIIESTWYTGDYTLGNLYDYTNIYSDSVLANVGLLHIGDMYIDNTYLITPSKNGFVYIVKDGNVMEQSISDLFTVKPSIFIKKDLNIIDGDGSLDNPYVVTYTDI